MGFQRAKWHSGLTYQQTCEQCNTTIQYKDDKLDFRPWFADGFVYCPTCQKPLRHKETYAINNPNPTSVNNHDATDMPTYANTAAPTTPVSDATYGFCPQCGKAFRKDDRFCSGCGTKKPE